MGNIAPASTFNIFSTAARTATHSSSFISPPYGANGVRIYLYCSVDPASASVTFQVQTRLPGDNELFTILESAALDTDEELLVLNIHPGAPTTSNVSAGWHIGDGFILKATHADTDSITYCAKGVWLPGY